MKCILIISCLLAGCAQLNNVQPMQTAEYPEALEASIPADVAEAVAILLGDRPYADLEVVKQSAQKIHKFERSVVLVEKTLQNIETGEYSKVVTHRFPRLGLDVTYQDGQVIGASRVQQN